MNYTMIGQLILKDWYFNKVPLLAYFSIGAIALSIINLGGETAFYVGFVLLVSVLIIVGAHLVFITVIHERKEQTLPFVMSLPVSFMEYTTAKILTNVLIFLVPWTALVIGVIIVVAGNHNFPNGSIPFLSIGLTELFVAHCLLLTVALVGESEGWSIVIMTICNIFVSIFWYIISHIPAIAADIEGPTAVWSLTVLWILTAEFCIIVLLLGLTFFLQSRKKDFL